MGKARKLNWRERERESYLERERERENGGCGVRDWSEGPIENDGVWREGKRGERGNPMMMRVWTWIGSDSDRYTQNGCWWWKRREKRVGGLQFPVWLILCFGLGWWFWFIGFGNVAVVELNVWNGIGLLHPWVKEKANHKGKIFLMTIIPKFIFIFPNA